MDHGKDLSDSFNNVPRLLAPYFDRIFAYNRDMLKSIPGSDDFCNVQDGDFPLNPGLNKMGCGDFKSFMIDHLLGEIEEDSILIYHDCNFSKYPQYWQTEWGRIKEICEFLLDSNQSDFFMPFEYDAFGIVPTVSMHGKRYTTDKIIGNKEEADLISGCWEIASSRMIIRNTPRSREFFADYKILCEQKDLLCKYPDPNPYPNFTHSTVDQHVLDCLIYKYILEGKLDCSFPKYAFRGRRLILSDDIEYRVNEELSKYMAKKSIKLNTFKTDVKDDKNIRGTKEFREDLFST